MKNLGLTLLMMLFIGVGTSMAQDKKEADADVSAPAKQKCLQKRLTNVLPILPRRAAQKMPNLQLKLIKRLVHQVARRSAVPLMLGKQIRKIITMKSMIILTNSENII